MRKVSYIFLSFVLVACSVGPDYERPEFFDDKPQSSHAENISKNWYYIFGDEVLNKLIDDALQNSPDIKIAKAKMRQARYMFEIKQTDYLPAVDVTGSYNYAYAPKYDELGDKTSYFKTGFDVSWEIDIWGGGRRQNESYAAQYEAAVYNLDDVLLSLTAEVANNYVRLRMTQEQLRISKENLNLQQNILNIVRDKYKSGLAEDMDLNQAEFAVQTTKALIPQLENQENTYKNVIAVLVGTLPNNLSIGNAKNGNIAAKTFSFDLQKLKDISFENIRNRPDVRVAENMLVAKNAEIGQAIAAMFPSVNIGALLGWQGHLLRDLTHSENAAYGYTPAVTMPFLHWGELMNQVKLSKEVKEQYLYAYQKALLTAAQETDNAIMSTIKEYEKNAALQRSVINMQQVLISMKIKYQEGLIEFSDLLTTEQNLLSAQNNLVSSRGNVYENIISFYKALGGGYCLLIPRK